VAGLQLPQPGIDDLPQLFANAQSSELRVTMTQHGASAALSPGLGLTIYRVVQESLTNAAKHAPGTDVDVALSFTSTHVVVEVRDNGPGAPTGVTKGLGLTGMTERVALYDGVLDVRGVSDGFVVTATFPLDREGEVSW
jgi:signal transduction histidine kinase